MSDKIRIEFNFEYAMLELFINGQIVTHRLPNKMPYPNEAFIDETIRTFEQILECSDIEMSEHDIEKHISEAFTLYKETNDKAKYVEIEVTVNPKTAAKNPPMFPMPTKEQLKAGIDSLMKAADKDIKEPKP